MKIFTASLLILISLTGVSAFAQETIIPDVNYSLLDKYIQSAKDNYPRHKLFDARAVSAHTAIPISIVSYLDIFTASYFYRPDNNIVITAPGTVGANPYSVNGFQFGVTVNLGSFLQKPFVARKAKADYRVAQLEAQEYDITLGVEVKRRYYNYLQQVAQLKVYTQSVLDNKNVADNLRYRFQKAEITLDSYNQSRINVTSAVTSKLQTEVNLLTAKDALEELVGKRLSDIK